jgi:hypothetical protein
VVGKAQSRESIPTCVYIIWEIIANMTQVSDVAPGPLVSNARVNFIFCLLELHDAASVCFAWAFHETLTTCSFCCCMQF